MPPHIVPILLAGAVLVGPADASAMLSADVQSTDVVSHSVVLTGVTVHRVRTYWTRARMERAVPMSPTSAPGRGPVTSVLSAPNAGAVWQGSGTVSTASGKVFFTLKGSDYVCSASTVDSASRDLVITAGHCAKDGGGAWATNWIFVPGYANGTGPVGEFPARRMFVTKAWANAGNENQDVAMVAVAPQNGHRVQDVAGGQRIAFGARRGGRIYSFGYPVQPPYDGQQLIYCSGQEHGDVDGHTSDEGLGCDMTQGSSGGPWLSQFDPLTGTGVITSVNTLKYVNDPSTMYGPFFGTAIQHLYKKAQAG